LNSGCIGKVVAIITIVFTLAVFGVGIYVFGTNVLIGLATENLLCCLVGIVALVGFGYLAYAMRGVFIQSE
jgi:hypothetical protein